MKLAQTLLASSILLFLLTWLWFEGSRTAASSAELRMNAITAFSMAQSTLYKDVLSARAGLLLNYDPLTRQITAMNDAVREMDATTNGDPEFAAAVAELRELVRSQDEWAESFKSQNSLLQSSLAHFAIFSNRFRETQGEAARRATALAAAMLRLTLNTSTAVVEDVETYIREVSMSDVPAEDALNTRALLAHAKLLHDLLPQTDTSLRVLLSLSSDKHLQGIRSLVAQRQQQAERRAGRFRYLLFITSLVLTGALVYFGLSLQARSRALRRRAEMDHVLAQMSTNFINSRAEDTAAIVSKGLADITACWHADRAYFTCEGAENRRYEWARPEAPFPAEGAQDHDSSKRRVIVTSNRPGMKASIGLDFLRSQAIPREDELNQLRMACDAIANALERTLNERERSRLEASLQRARQMEIVGALASGVAHNFNNIISAISGLAESAQSRLPQDTRTTEDLSEIRRAGNRAAALVDQLLTFARRGSPLTTSISLNALVWESKTLLEASLPSAITVAIKEPAAPVTVIAAPAQLQQVILNIANNAAQAMDLAGVIDIAIEERRIDQPTRLDIAELAPGNYGVLTIADSGRGMDALVRERIFEPFFTTRVAGNGLGLATVREIVLEHGGGLQVQSTPGVGTRFEIWLPAGAPAQSLPPEPVEGADHHHGNGEIVLVFEANPQRLLRLEEILAALGYEPVGYTDADAAITACASEPERFDAALLCSQARNHAQDVEAEIRMSARLRTAAASLPIILATTSARELSAPALVGHNISAIIGQPPSMAELATSLAQCLRTRLLQP